MEPFGSVKLEVRHVEGSQDHLSGSQGASSALPPGFAIDPEDDSVSDTTLIFGDSHEATAYFSGIAEDTQMMSMNDPYSYPVTAPNPSCSSHWRDSGSP